MLHLFPLISRTKTSSGLHYVLSSLTQNHLKILQTLSRETTSKEGISFSNLYELCLSEMLVSSEKSLQLIIKELEDHELIKKVVNASSPQESYVCLVSSKELKLFCDNNLFFVCLKYSHLFYIKYISFYIHYNGMLFPSGMLIL